MKSNKLKTQVYVIKNQNSSCIIKVYPATLRYKTLFSTNKSYIINEYHILPDIYTSFKHNPIEFFEKFTNFKAYEIENTKEVIEKEIFLIGL